MTNSSKTSQETEYDDIVRKLDALLSKHKRPNVASMDSRMPVALSSTPAPSTPLGKEEVPLAARDNIPTLTETVQVAPAMLSSHADTRSLLSQILDSALKDTGVDLDGTTRGALVQALESRLFSL